MNRRPSSKRAGNETNNELETLFEEIDEIEKILEPLKAAESDSLRSEMEEQKKNLESVDKTALPSLQEEIRNIKESAETLVTKSFLSDEIDLIEKMLVSIKVNRLKRAELNFLELEKEVKKKRLQSADEYELAALRKEIGKIKERAESLASRESWPVRLSRVSVLVWLGFIPLLIALYTGYLAILQWQNQPQIRRFATQTAEAMPTVTPSATEAPATPIQ